MDKESRDKFKELKFISIGGLKVYSPALSDGRREQKHSCPDCHFCQFCSDTRCQSCRGGEKPSACHAAGKSSGVESVALFDDNRAETQKHD